MIDVLFSIALIVQTIALVVMSIAIKHLSDEIDELEGSFEYHKKIHKYERLMTEQKIKEFIQLLNQFEKSINKEENENQN